MLREVHVVPGILLPATMAKLEYFQEAHQFLQIQCLLIVLKGLLMEQWRKERE